jgi:hypothetical protein
MEVSAAIWRTPTENTNQVFHSKRKHPISSIPALSQWQLNSNMMHRLWNDERATITRGHAGTTCYHAEEELVFVCERYDGSDLPIDGTEEPIQ